MEEKMFIFERKLPSQLWEVCQEVICLPAAPASGNATTNRLVLAILKIL